MTSEYCVPSEATADRWSSSARRVERVAWSARRIEARSCATSLLAAWLVAFSRAATRLGVPRSTVSRSLSGLERSLKIELFHRTTRSVQATEEAKSLYDRVQGSLTGLETALVEAPRKQETPSGTLRLTATNDIGLTLLAEAITRFVARFPEVECEVNLAPRVVVP